MSAALMMAAMMLPGAIPAVIRADRHALSAAFFAASYFAVWALVGLAFLAVSEPAGTTAVVLVIAAVVYEVTPLKREFRRRCQEQSRSGVQFGFYCVGSSLGLMIAAAAIAPMSIVAMAVAAGIALIQKIVPVAPERIKQI